MLSREDAGTNGKAQRSSPLKSSTQRVLAGFALIVVASTPGPVQAQDRYTGADGRLRVALAKQPFSPGTPPGPSTMANGGIQDAGAHGAVVRVAESALTEAESGEHGGWKRLAMALGHFADIVAQNEREGWFTVGLLATCPSMPGLVAGLQHSGPTHEPMCIGMLWLVHTATSTRRRRHGADLWVGCRWQSRPGERCMA